MPVEANKAVIRRWFEAFDRKDMAGIREQLAPGFVYHEPSAPGGVITADQALALVEQAFVALLDVRWTLEDMVAEGDRVAIRYTSCGTQHGEYLGRPPTGQVVTRESIPIYRFAGGKIVEGWIKSGGPLPGG